MSRVSQEIGFLSQGGYSYVEVDVQIACASKFPVTDLESNGHPVIVVQHLVEALFRMSLERDVVRIGEREQAEQCDKEEGEKRHNGGGAARQDVFTCW